ncbi:esterase-like activity of phytase family protein [uncultured Christiangramia sp.]|uniref:esterase-like activity of phytase family protein n=1 Tax=uncultured Christiangramia sp. TaxID=503836 RepID=UPI0026251966|nr:esterase-like activity of phytase family protein [uncultured Christiangramia sp.]
MKLRLLSLFLIFTFFSCAVTSRIENDHVSLNYLDEFVIDENLEFENTKIGGLSGIDYASGKFYLVSDQSSNPRIYQAVIKIANSRIQNIEINDLIEITRPEEYSKVVLDLEGVRYDSNNNGFLVVSEGLISDRRDPGIYETNTQGEILSSYSIPEYFGSKNDQKPRNNVVFEGITKSVDGAGVWVATELPLEKDSSKPKIFPSRSHSRITRFDTETGNPVSQFVYPLEGIAKLPINYFALNGITEILEYAQDRFLVMERSYSAGYGSHGNTVKIFDVDASKATNTLNENLLRKAKYQTAKKKLIFNFKSVNDQLTDGIVDNIEGMCFGPELENGNRSLILVADNNFNSFVRQLNQFILMEINISE